jgi:hypothetical protein
MLRSYTGGLAWGWAEELLAINAELTHGLARVTMAAAVEKKHRSKIPKEWHVKRPWEVQTKPRVITGVREMVSALGPVLGRGSYG